MDDLIRRQTAIDALKICDANYDGTNCEKCPLRDDRWNGAWCNDVTDCHTELMRDTAKLLETLSAQPDIIYCKDCKHHWTYKCMDGMPIENCDLEQTFYDANIDFCSLAERREK